MPIDRTLIDGWLRRAFATDAERTRVMQHVEVSVESDLRRLAGKLKLEVQELEDHLLEIHRVFVKIMKAAKRLGESMKDISTVVRDVVQGPDVLLALEAAVAELNRKEKPAREDADAPTAPRPRTTESEAQR